jgi:hypothetical protein
MGLFARFTRETPVGLEDFFIGVERYNERFNALSSGDKTISLVHPFWSYDAINKGLALRSDWAVPAHLVPFYGDWHDLLCLNLGNGSVLMLNDQRQIVEEWASVEAFESALTSLPGDGVDSTGIIDEESWLDI